MLPAARPVNVTFTGLLFVGDGSGITGFPPGTAYSDPFTLSVYLNDSWPGDVSSASLRSKQHRQPVVKKDGEKTNVWMAIKCFLGFTSWKCTQ